MSGPHELCGLFGKWQQRGGGFLERAGYGRGPGIAERITRIHRHSAADAQKRHDDGQALTIRPEAPGVLTGADDTTG